MNPAFAPNGAFSPLAPPLWFSSPLLLPFAQPQRLFFTPQLPHLSPVSAAPKPKLFRPWDDSHSDQSSSSSSPSSTSISPPSAEFSAVQQQISNSTDDVERQSALEAVATNMGKTADGHKCIYCSKVYSRKYGLRIHLRTHTGFKPLQCKVCKRAFGDPSNLNKHSRLHEQNGSFKCKLCGKLLVRKRDLDRHMNTRHGEFEESVDVETV